MCLRLTDQLAERFARLVRNGLPPRTACDYLNISYQPSYMNWMKRGHDVSLDSTSYDELKPHDRRCLKFYKLVTKAIATHRKKVIKRLHDPDNEQWRREMSILERRDPANWGRHLTIETADDTVEPDMAYL